MNKLVLVSVTILLLCCSLCEAQVKSPRRQQRIDRRIEQLVNKRYGIDSLRYQVIYDRERKELAIISLQSLKDSNRQLIARIDSFRVVDSLSKSDAVFADKTINALIADNYQGKLSIAELNARLEQLLRGYDSISALPPVIRYQPAQPVVIKASGVPHLSNATPTDREDSLLRVNSALLARKIYLLKVNQQLVLHNDSLVKNLDKANGTISTLKTNLGIFLLLAFVALAGCAVIYFIFFGLRLSVKFCSCFVVELSEGVIYADTLFDKGKCLELRKYEHKMLSKVIGAKPVYGDIFRVIIIEARKSKHFIYKKGSDVDKRKFNSFHEHRGREK